MSTSTEAEEKPPSRCVACHAVARPVRNFTQGPVYRRAENIQTINRISLDFRRRHFPKADDREWNDWHWQFRNRLRDLKDFERILNLTADERLAVSLKGGRLPVAVTPYYAALICRDNPESRALRRCVVPSMAERVITTYESGDPLSEEHDSPVPGIVHRYPDRVLFLATDICSTYCRYCTRSRRVGRRGEHRAHRLQSWDGAIAYIQEHREVRDVLISGGDPLTLPDTSLEYLLSRITSIPHVEIVRIGTKVPMVLPQRITASLTRMLRRYHPLFISIHCTHPAELTPEAALACTRLADAGIPLGSQTVLLQGVNDNVETMTALFQGLLKMRVRPYYLYQCDQVSGTAHFRTSLSTGLGIIQGIRGFTSGYAVPQFVVDLPGGGGKVTVCPEYLTGRYGDFLTFKNYEGKTFRSFDPIETPAYSNAPVPVC